jgi:tRNA A37 threonylcarbamoyladenosine synthetase subunit TsaC/SUA5/YrdC
MKTVMLESRTENSFAQAVELLFAGKLVVVPIETIYGLVADANSKKPVDSIFTTRGRQLSTN